MTDVFYMEDSILDPFQRMKKKRINSVREILRKLKKVNLKEFIAKIRINCGIHERTIREYLDALETVGEISIREGVITFNEERQPSPEVTSNSP
jgi:predicted transcriptional regulator